MAVTMLPVRAGGVAACCIEAVVDDARNAKRAGLRPVKHIERMYPHTPDGRYFVVRGRLWRASNPSLVETQRAALVRELMAARAAKGRAIRAGDAAAREAARQRVDAAKHALGERGPVWWHDGAPDFNRRLARNSPYAAWWAGVEAGATPKLDRHSGRRSRTAKAAGA